MEISKIFVVHSELTDLNKGLDSQHFYAEVVLLEQNLGYFHPQLYCLKSTPLTPIENLEKLRREFIPLHRDAFIQIGEISHIETHKKLVYLADNKLVSYKYMIIVSPQHQMDELSTVLSTLKDALLLDAMNVKDRINHSIDSQAFNWEHPPSNLHRYQQSFLKRTHEKKSIDEVAQPHLVNSDTFSSTINSVPIRVSQVKM